jgi:hypothetical protein
MPLRILYLSVVVLLGAVIQLLSSSTGSIAACWVSASLVSIISHGLWRFSDLASTKFGDELFPAGGALAGIVGGTAASFLQSGANRLAWTAVAASLISSGVAIWSRSRVQSEVCFHHRLRLTSVFQCPRCRQKFCGKSDCWSSRGVRCQRCQQHEVLLFNVHDELWWTERFGQRVNSGSCMKCLSAAANSQVQECGQCHWQMCRRCWDLDNCQCRKCGWMPDGLPETLTVLMPVRPAASRASSRTAVAGRRQRL